VSGVAVMSWLLGMNCTSEWRGGMSWFLGMNCTSEWRGGNGLAFRDKLWRE
jgi:hypothetical protein